jgi:alkylation response protein AidB-like acyl-CoA dehydrogenase
MEVRVPTEAVSLRRDGAGPLPRLSVERARAAAPPGAAPDLDRAQQVASDLGPWVPLPMQGDTLTLWECLASLGAVDLTVARVAEPHIDALAILREARRHGQVLDDDWRHNSPEWSAARLWQVYAAEGGERLQAKEDSDGWTLNGPKPWCSLAGRASHALVTAWVDDDERRLFAVALTQAGVTPLDEEHEGVQSTTWAARGLSQVRSTGLLFEGVPAVPICHPSWYLTRPGFAWGGVGVSAVWFGAAVGLARTLRAAATRREPDQVALLHLGAVDTALARARAMLAEAALVADDGTTEGAEAVLVTQRTRQVVADAAEEVLTRVGHALGPAPLTGDEDHARRVADLTVYLRQHHAERDLARQGQQVLGEHHGWRWW